MSAATTTVIMDELRDLHNGALRDIGRMCREQAVILRRAGIKHWARDEKLQASYAFGAAQALDEMGRVFEKR